MAINLHGRNFLSLEGYSPEEIGFLLQLSAELKAAKYAGTEQPRLTRRNIALIFEKASTRTRTGFEVAAYDQGANVTYLGPTGSHIGHKELMKDTARVLGRVYDAIEYRGFAQQLVEELADYAGVPVYNGLTDETHPTQTLADFLTMREHAHRPLSELTVAFAGDGKDNVARSLAIGAVKMGIDMRIAAPRPLWPDPDFVKHANAIGAGHGARLTVTEDIDGAVGGADFIYTDVWLSMGEDEADWGERIKLLTPYRVTTKMMQATGKTATKFMHCLPAFHNKETTVGADIVERFGIDCMEVSDEVFELPASVVFDQAENRMHTIKAVLVATIGG